MSTTSPKNQSLTVVEIAENLSAALSVAFAACSTG